MGYAVQNITALPFKHIIGAPLVAAIEAQGMAAKSTMDFIMHVGFTTPTDDVTDATKGTPDFGDVRMVTFKYTQNLLKADGTPDPKDVSLSVPLLTIVPIPFLAIQEMNIDFMAKITEAISYDSTNKNDDAKSASLEAKVGWGPVSGGFKGSLSSSHSSTSSSSSKYNTELTMNIRVRATQDDMPAGMKKVLEILAAAVKSSPVATA